VGFVALCYLDSKK